MAKCKYCDRDTDEGELCASCLSVGVSKIFCEECGKPTGDWGFPDDGTRCDSCIYGSEGVV